MTVLVDTSEAAVSAKVEELKALATARWEARVSQGAFVRGLEAGTLPFEKVQRFYHNLAQFVLTSNALNLQVYYRQIRILRRHWDLWELFAGKIVDEFGTPQPPGHTRVLLKTGRALGLTDEQMLFQPVSARAQAMPNFLRTLVEHGAPVDYWAAGLSESFFGTFSQTFGQALVRSYGIKREDIIYWKTHHEQDLEEHDGRMGHGSFNETMLRRLLGYGYADDPMSFGLELCATTNVDMFALLLDDVMED